MDRYKVTTSSRSRVDPATGHLLLDEPSAGGPGFTLQPATATRLGGIKVGRNLVMEGETLNAAAPPAYDDTELRGVVTDSAAAIEDLRDVIEGGSGGGPTSIPTASETVKGGIRVGGANSNVRMVDDVLYVDNMRYDDVPLYNMIVAKQERLIDGWNVKTVNGESILGTGNIVVGGSGGGADPGAGGREERNHWPVGEGFTYGGYGAGGGYSAGATLRDADFNDVGRWNLAATRVVESLETVQLHMVAELTRTVEMNELGQHLEVNYSPGTLLPNRTVPVFLEMQTSPWGTLTLNPDTPARLKGTGPSVSWPLYLGQWVMFIFTFDKLTAEWMDTGQM